MMMKESGASIVGHVGRLVLAVFLLAVGTVACAAGEHLPLRTQVGKPVVQLVWVGVGKAYVHRNSAYQRSPEHDYEFTVLQDRFPDHWESVKNMHRRHPGYDGSAGPRDQSHHFQVSYGPVAGAKAEVPFTIVSSMGPGTGITDAEFRKTELVLMPEISSLAPFNRIRFRQSYLYEEGRLQETVELYKATPAGEMPFVRMEEEARIFAETKLAGAPTRR